MYVYTLTGGYMYVYMYVHVYVYHESVSFYACIYIYTYMYMYVLIAVLFSSIQRNRGLVHSNLSECNSWDAYLENVVV